jgi:hypothetical protein
MSRALIALALLGAVAVPVAAGVWIVLWAVDPAGVACCR